MEQREYALLFSKTVLYHSRYIKRLSLLRTIVSRLCWAFTGLRTRLHGLLILDFPETMSVKWTHSAASLTVHIRNAQGAGWIVVVFEECPKSNTWGRLCIFAYGRIYDYLDSYTDIQMYWWRAWKGTRCEGGCFLNRTTEKVISILAASVIVHTSGLLYVPSGITANVPVLTGKSAMDPVWSFLAPGLGKNLFKNILYLVLCFCFQRFRSSRKSGKQYSIPADLF